MFREGFDELILFFKNIIHIFAILFSLIVNRPKMVIHYLARLLRRINETLAVYFSNYRLNREDLIKTHDYFQTELIKLNKRIKGLHLLLNSQKNEANIGFSIIMLVTEDNKEFALEGLDLFSDLSGNNYELIIGCFLNDDDFLKLTSRKNNSEKVKFIKIVNELHRNNSDIYNQLRLVDLAKFEYTIFCRIQDWPRPDLLYRLETSLLLVKNPKEYALVCAEVGFLSHNDVYDISRINTFDSNQLPYFFMKGSYHLICCSRSSLNRIENISNLRSIFHLGLELNYQGISLYTIPFELYHYRVGQSEEEELIEVWTDYYRKCGINLAIDKTKGLNPYYFTMKPIYSERKKIHVIVLYKDYKEVTLECARLLKQQTYENIHVTFVDNSSEDKGICNNLKLMGFEVITIDEPFNYSRLNNLGVSLSTCKDADSILFLNNDVYLERDAVEKLSLWINMPQVGIVGGLLSYEDGTIQHAGIYVDKVMNKYIPWEHQDLGLKISRAKTGTALRTVEAVTGACLMISKKVFEDVGGWDEVFYPISFSDTDLCRRVRRLGLKIMYTPDCKGIHLESKSRGFSLMEDYECSSWLFWQTENRKNDNFIKHHFLDIPELFK